MKAILVDDKGWRNVIKIDKKVKIIHWSDGLVMIDFELNDLENGVPVFKQVTRRSKNPDKN